MNHEEKCLHTIKNCPICESPFEQGLDKFWNNRDYAWIGWCKKCSAMVVAIMGELESLGEE